MIEFFVAFADEISVLGPQALIVERAPDGDEQLVDLERLLQVVERAELHRLDRALDRRVGGHHDDLRPLGRRRGRHELANQVDAAQLGHQVVDDEDVEEAPPEEPLRLARAPGGQHLVPFFRASPAPARCGSWFRRRRAESFRLQSCGG